MDEGLLVLDESRRVLLANPVMCELLGLPPKTGGPPGQPGAPRKRPVSNPH
ncbi:MAG: PAS domain-containing protein [Hymenobacter sp.]